MLPVAALEAGSLGWPWARQKLQWNRFAGISPSPSPRVESRSTPLARVDRRQRPQHPAPTGTANDSRMAHERLDAHEAHRASRGHWQCRGPALLGGSQLDHWTTPHRRWRILADGSGTPPGPTVRLTRATLSSSLANNLWQLRNVFALLRPPAVFALIAGNFSVMSVTQMFRFESYSVRCSRGISRLRTGVSRCVEFFC